MENSIQENLLIEDKEIFTIDESYKMEKRLFVCSLANFQS